MTPRRYQSGEVDHGGRISKCGDGMVRGLLFEAAKVLLSRSARPSALKTWGEALGKRIGAKRQRWRLPASLPSSCTACGPPARRSNGALRLHLQPPEVDRIIPSPHLAAERLDDRAILRAPISCVSAFGT
jgi:hypothetical protein